MTFTQNGCSVPQLGLTLVNPILLVVHPHHGYKLNGVIMLGSLPYVLLCSAAAWSVYFVAIRHGGQNINSK